MRVYVGFDDTDVLGADRGTGKLARWFEQKMPEGSRMYGVVRQQLPVLEGIPYTSHNSSACVIVDNVEPSQVEELIELGAQHIRDHFMEGSDPGLCIVAADVASVDGLVEFGRLASSKIVTQQQAMRAVNGFHLSGHGGTNDGIIGAAAGVGLTIAGWSGRFIEFAGLRDFGTMARVGDIEARGIRVLSIDRNALVAGPDDMVDTRDWLRPRDCGAVAQCCRWSPADTAVGGASTGKTKRREQRGRNYRRLEGWYSGPCVRIAESMCLFPGCWRTIALCRHGDGGFFTFSAGSG